MAAMSGIYLMLGLTLMLFISGVSGHGWVSKPTPRQLCNGQQWIWDTTKSGGHAAYKLDPPYGGVPGLCGDPFGGRKRSNFAGLPCDPQVTYSMNSNIKITVAISTNHGGCMTFNMCDKKNINQACFDANPLKRVGHDSYQYCILKNDPSKGGVDNPEYYNMQFELPKDMTCEHCVLQWTWWTAHNCQIECTDSRAVCGQYLDRKSYVVRPNQTWNNKICASAYPKRGEKPQMYRNCMDLTITGSGSGAANRLTESTVELRGAEQGGDTEMENSVATDSMTEDSTGDETSGKKYAKKGGNVSQWRKENCWGGKWKTNRKCWKKGGERWKKYWSETKAKKRSTDGYSDTDETRRRLLADGNRVAEDDTTDNISAAGMISNCKHARVDEVLEDINFMRADVDADPLACSNRATGVAANFAEIMCDQGRLLHDGQDNCALSKFGKGCEEIVFRGGASPFNAMSDPDIDVLLATDFTKAGVGFYECDGETFWTILMGA